MPLKCHHYPYGFIAQMIFFAAVPFSAFSMYLPAFPTIEADLGISREAISFTLMASMISFPISSLFMGPLSDAIGRRPMLFMTFCLFTIGSIICACANGSEMLFVGRAFQGAGGAGTAILSRAMCRDFLDDIIFMDAVGWLGIVLGVVPLFAPTIGGYITPMFGWRMNFIFLIAMGLVCLAMVWMMTRETHHRSLRIKLDIKVFFREYANLFLSRDYQKVLFPSYFFFIFLGLYVSLVSFYLPDNGFSPFEFGIVQGLVCGMMIIGRCITIFGLKKGVKEVTFWMLSAYVLAFCSLTVIPIFVLDLPGAVYWVMGAIGVCHIGVGIVAPIVGKNTMAVMPWIPGISSSLTVALMVLLEAVGCMIASAVMRCNLTAVFVIALMILGIGTLITSYYSQSVIVRLTSKIRSAERD